MTLSLLALKARYVETLSIIYEGGYRAKCRKVSLNSRPIVYWQVQKIGWFGWWWNTEWMNHSSHEEAMVTINRLAREKAAVRFEQLVDRVVNG